MRWSIRLGRVLGIDIYVHLTFLLLLAWVVISAYNQTHSVARALFELAFICLVFATVVMHEYGHALTARQFGVKTRDITLLPIGGVARLERIPENPLQEFLIAIAGPAVNVVLAAVCLAVLLASGRWGPDADISKGLLQGGLLERFFFINVALVVFNAIPAFPMDGGRVLRSILAMGMDYVRATQIAARVGQGIAFLFGVLGLLGMFGGFGNPMLLLIALFVWMGAAQEAAMVATRARLKGLSARSAMVSNYVTVGPDDPLAYVAQFVSSGYQEDFPVLQDGRMVGILTRSDLLKALQQFGGSGRVAEVMRREFPVAGPDEPLHEVVARLQTAPYRALAVIDHGQLVGLVTPGNVGQLLLQRAATGQHRQPI